MFNLQLYFCSIILCAIVIGALWQPIPGLEPYVERHGRRTARPSKKTAVSGYGRVNPSRLLGSEIEKRTGPARPVRTRPFRRVMMYPQIMQE